MVDMFQDAAIISLAASSILNGITIRRILRRLEK